MRARNQLHPVQHRHRIEPLGGEDEAEIVAKRLLSTLVEPFSFAGAIVDQHASLGVVVWDKTSKSTTEVVQSADVALYEAKRQGKGHLVVYSSGMHQQAVGRFTLAQELERALNADELSMHYQPIINLSTNDVVGFEALMRWQHPEQGQIPPNVFIPLAEESDLILELGFFALHEAVALASTISSLIILIVSLAPGATPARLLSAVLQLNLREIGKLLPGASMGFLWFGSIILYSISTVKLGDLGTSIGWPLFLASIVVASTIFGFLTGEWEKTGTRPKRTMILGVGFLVVAIGILSYAGRP